jgi:hypothetical protein
MADANTPVGPVEGRALANEIGFAKRIARHFSCL